MSDRDGTEDARTRIDRAVIRYPRLGALHNDIRLCQQLSHETGEPQCMALSGVPGAGKTTLAKWYAAAFPRARTEEKLTIPVLYIETPSPATVKSVASRMLRELGDPAHTRGTLWSMNGRLIDYVKECEVDLVILDDLHHLIDRETNEVLMQVSEWLKVLIKETAVPFLTVSIEGATDEIFRTNDQLSRLFPVRETLQPFRWDTADASALAEFSQFVTFAERAVAMEMDPSITRIDALSRVHYATQGVVAYIMTLLRYAALQARTKGHGTIEISDLEHAFAQRLAKHVRRAHNPFTRAGEPFVAPPDEPAADPESPVDDTTKGRTTRKDSRKGRGRNKPAP